MTLYDDKRAAYLAELPDDGVDATTPLSDLERIYYAKMAALASSHIGSLLAYADLAGKTFHPKSILDYPALGSTLSETHVDSREDPDSPYVMYLGAGKSGVVRNVHVTQCATSGSRELIKLYDVRLKVWTDLGDLTTEEQSSGPSDTPTLDIPLKIYGGCVYDTSDAKGIETAIGTYTMVAAPASNESVPTFALDINLPMPFANGIYIQVVGEGSGPMTGGFSYCSYELGALPAWPYKDWRLRGQMVYASSLAKNATETWLNVASGKPGMLVGLWYALSPDPLSKEHLSPSFDLVPDGLESAKWSSGHSEDIVEANTYTYVAGALAKLRSGVTYFDYGVSNKVEAYRIFTDTPIVWQDGAVGTWKNDSSTGTPGTVEFSSFALYYAP